jgi:hypothetical protein
LNARVVEVVVDPLPVVVDATVVLVVEVEEVDGGIVLVRLQADIDGQMLQVTPMSLQANPSVQTFVAEQKP